MDAGVIEEDEGLLGAAAHAPSRWLGQRVDFVG
jgi:hypothetical protein